MRMQTRTARVVTNETCNQNCAFCHARQPREQRAFIAPAAVRCRIELNARADTELILTGGEPTLRLDLEALVTHARASNAGAVALETNAALIDAPRARALAAAGLDIARIHAPAWDETLDAMTRDPGAFAATSRGARALADAGVTLVACTPVVRANARGGLAQLPQQLARSGLPWQTLEVGVPTSAPNFSALLPLRDAAMIIADMDLAARDAAIPMQFGEALIPPCCFPTPALVAHVFSLTAGGASRPGYRRTNDCNDCRAADRCPGFPVAALKREPNLRAIPLTQDRIRRRLSRIGSVATQIERELAQDDVYRTPHGEVLPGRIVRINFRCNQSCHFCFVSTHLPSAQDAAIRREIVSIARKGGVAALSGGEPTLNPALLDYVRLARAEGARHVELQTNAIRLAEPGFADNLIAAGTDQLHVSLHGSTAAISDAITNAPGTFKKTLLGIDAAARTSVTLRLNFVFCETNRRDFPDFVDLVARRWPKAHIIISFVAASTDLVPRTKDLVPRYTDVLDHLSEGCRRADEHGVAVAGLESLCGIPLCLLPGDLTKYFDLAQIPDGLDRGETVKTEACTRCALRGRCFGLRGSYAELHGTDELVPVSREDAAGNASLA